MNVLFGSWKRCSLATFQKFQKCLIRFAKFQKCPACQVFGGTMVHANDKQNYKPISIWIKTNYFHSVVDNQAILSNLFSGGSGRPLPGPFLRYDELKIINVGRNGRGVEKDPLQSPTLVSFIPAFSRLTCHDTRDQSSPIVDYRWWELSATRTDQGCL